MMANWTGFDLNLMAVFDAVMQERSLTRAALLLGLSQPAVSHALARLRTAVGDQLFVRGPDGMAPTPRAERMAEPVREALAAMRMSLEAISAEPADMARRFAIAVNGYTAFALANRIVGALWSQAPGLDLAILPSGTRDVLRDLDSGLIDLALTAPVDGGERFKCSRVLSDGYVAVMRRDHPAAASDLTLHSLAGLRHLALTSTGDDTRFLDEALETAGLRRTIALGLPFLAAPEALANSDLVAILPTQVSARLRAAWPLIERALPCPAPATHLSMVWHRRADAHAEHVWLRTTIRRSLSGLSHPS